MINEVRNFVQDDGHIFCTNEQIQEEVQSFIDLDFEVYKTFGFNSILDDSQQDQRKSWKR